MEAMVVPRDGFPNRRVTKCCGRKTRPGESVVVVDNTGPSFGHNILHKRCLAALLITMPADASDYVAKFNDLKANMALQGTAFPKKKKPRGPRGPLAPQNQKPYKAPKRTLRSVG